MKRRFLIAFMMIATLLCGCIQNVHTIKEEDQKIQPSEPSDVAEPTVEGQSFSTEADEDALAVLQFIEGQWLCETGQTYIDIYRSVEAYYVNIHSGIGVSGRNFSGSPFFKVQLGYPHYMTWGEEPAENEVVVYVSTMRGEFDYELFFLVDENGEYIKYQVSESEKIWYYFYPYEKEMSIGKYLFVPSLAAEVKEIVENEEGFGGELSDEALHMTGEKLAGRDVFYFFPHYCAVTVMEDGSYKIEGLCKGLKEREDGSLGEGEYDVVLYIDENGNPIKEDLWSLLPHEK